MTLNGGARSVAEVMSTPHWLVVRNDTDAAADIFEMMEQYSLASVPIVSSTDRSWRGLVLFRDLVSLRERTSGFGRTTAAKVARSELSLSPSDSLASALERMREHEVGRLPVVYGRTLVGSITRSDARTNIESQAEIGPPRGWLPASFTASLRGLPDGEPTLDRWEELLRAERSGGYRLAQAIGRFETLRDLLRIPLDIRHPLPPTLEGREQRVRKLRHSLLRRFLPRSSEAPSELQPEERPVPGPLLDGEIDASLQLLAHVPFEELQERGWHLQPKHFYWPLNDLKFLRANPRLWHQPRPMAGIDVDLAGQEELARELSEYTGELRDVKEQHPKRPGEFFWDNNSFPPVDAQVYYGLTRRLDPRRVIEVGAGFSSLILARALAANGGQADVTLVEPYPDPGVLGKLPDGWRLVRSILQDAPLEIFDDLAAGDILFYDGSHCITTGSDVEWFFFHVLPRVRPGVWIHVHDIFWPGDYSERFVLHEGLSWNEQYVLEAFLTHNDSYKLRLASAMLLTWKAELMEECFSGVRLGGSVWIEKTR
jgi:predicted transcriptional regulator